MMKYKLIKTYPGSPELGTVVEEFSKYGKISYSYLPNNKISGLVSVLSNHVEDNPEYWEKINDNLWWVVFRKDIVHGGPEYFSAWTAHHIECIHAPWDKSREYFKTKEEAEEFILFNKPCLSLNNVRGLLNKAEMDIIKGFIKSKL